MIRLLALTLLVSTLLFGCKEPPAVEILILDKDTGAPIEGAAVYVKNKRMGETDDKGRVFIASKDRRNVLLTVKKSDYFDWRHTVKNLSLVDKVKMQAKPDLAHSSEFRATRRHNYQDEEYENFLKSLSKVDTASLPEDCDYLGGIYSRDATFPGGQVGLMQFIQENVNYPEDAIDMGEQGKVYLSFVVGKDGSISDVTVERGVSRALDREAKRVLRSMPNWNPGYCSGKRVQTRCRLPIVFTLN